MGGVPARAMFLVAEIERILVVKLDHIGDFVTALPPIRRLRKIFPQARISVLAGPESGGFIALEPCIDEFIPFSFFHTRSQLGERVLSKEDYAALAAQLRPYRFDLAVDLRKHPSTRDVLRYTGARFLAGYDYLGQFPFLDIALDWGGDRRLQRKRNHIVDDLVVLVDAIGHATENDRLVMQPGPAAMPLSELPADVRRLFAKPVVAIHPGAGNMTKQWPQAHFSALIDLLIEKHDISIMLVGGPDDVETVEGLLQAVLHGGAVASMAGRTALADLPRFAEELRAVHRERQWPQARCCRGRHSDDRHPFRGGRSDRMGSDRPDRGGVAAEHVVQPVLPGDRRGLPASDGLPGIVSSCDGI